MFFLYPLSFPPKIGNKCAECCVLPPANDGTIALLPHLEGKDCLLWAQLIFSYFHLQKKPMIRSSRHREHEVKNAVPYAFSSESCVFIGSLILDGEEQAKLGIAARCETGPLNEGRGFSVLCRCYFQHKKRATRNAPMRPPPIAAKSNPSR